MASGLVGATGFSQMTIGRSLNAYCTQGVGNLATTPTVLSRIHNGVPHRRGVSQINVHPTIVAPGVRTGITAAHRRYPRPLLLASGLNFGAPALPKRQLAVHHNCPSCKKTATSQTAPTAPSGRACANQAEPCSTSYDRPPWRTAEKSCKACPRFASHAGR